MSTTGIREHPFSIDFKQIGQVINVILHKGITSAINAALTIEGQLGYDSTLKRIKYRDDTTIQLALSNQDIATDLLSPSSTTIPSTLAVVNGTLSLGNGLQPKYNFTSTDYTLLTTDFHLDVNAGGSNRIVYLPQALLATKGTLYNIKKTDGSGNTVTLQAYGSETIDGFNTRVISTPLHNIMIISTGANSWSIL